MSGKPAIKEGIKIKRALFKALPIILFVLNESARAELSARPRVLMSRSDLTGIINKIRPPSGSFGKLNGQFVEFVNESSNIDNSIPYDTTADALHAILNKVMKNAFLYRVGDGNVIESSCVAGYYPDRSLYLDNIKGDLLYLINNRNAIEGMTTPEGAGYAAKALAIAYDWGDYSSKSIPTDAQIRDALTGFADWFAAGCYASVYTNHAPWETKAMAYIGAALGDSTYFYGTATKNQTSVIPPGGKQIQAGISKFAMPFFEQIMSAVSSGDFGDCSPSYPRGGWHEGVSYFLVKELPELLEYAEVVCTYHDVPAYTDGIFSSNIFRYSGDFLLQMTTPDGMFMKYGDTGQKTALPTEHGAYDPVRSHGDSSCGKSYGDINNVGAGYVSGYHLYRLYHRLNDAGLTDYARLVQYYADNYCFDGIRPDEEKKINYIYKFIWQTGDEAPATWAGVKNTGILSLERYFDNLGVFISRQTFHDMNEGPYVNQGTVVRFDAQPLYYGVSQHFAAGNFTIFKKGNLAVDGGRYIGSADYGYHDGKYRSSACHNVVLFGDSAEQGQDAFTCVHTNYSDPFTKSHRLYYQKYAAGYDNASINTTEAGDPFDAYDCQYRTTRVILDNVYSKAGVIQYYRYLAHLLPKDPTRPEKPDFIVIYDWIDLDRPEKADWQMHFDDENGARTSGTNCFMFERDVTINPPALVKENFGNSYHSSLFIKCMASGDAALRIGTAENGKKAARFCISSPLNRRNIMNFLPSFSRP